MSDITCAVCDRQSPSFSWTDTHGVAQCTSCGTPYRIYHYEGEGENTKRIDKAPECLARSDWIPLLRQCHTDTGRYIPGGHSFPGGYELARAEDFSAFGKWCSEHRSEIDELKETG